MSQVQILKLEKIASSLQNTSSNKIVINTMKQNGLLPSDSSSYEFVHPGPQALRSQRDIHLVGNGHPLP